MTSARSSTNQAEELHFEERYTRVMQRLNFGQTPKAMSARSWAPSPRGAPSLGLLPAAGARMNEGPREYVATDYDSVLRLWTRSSQFTSLEQMDNVLTVIRDVRVVGLPLGLRRQVRRGLPPDGRSAPLAPRALAHGDARAARVLRRALRPEAQMGRSRRAEQPAWIVRLIDDEGTETAPPTSRSSRSRAPSSSPITRTRPLGGAPSGSPSRRCARTAVPRSLARRAGSGCASPVPRGTRRSPGRSSGLSSAPRLRRSRATRAAAARSS